MIALAHRLQVAWCAGLIDGEGSIAIRRRAGSSLQPLIRVQMTHRGAVERLQRVFHAGTVTTHAQRPPRGRSWTWHLHKRLALLEVLHELEPYLVVKRWEAAILVAFLKNPELSPAKRLLLFEEMKSCKLLKGKKP